MNLSKYGLEWLAESLHEDTKIDDVTDILRSFDAIRDLNVAYEIAEGHQFKVRRHSNCGVNFELELGDKPYQIGQIAYSLNQQLDAYLHESYGEYGEQGIGIEFVVYMSEEWGEKLHEVKAPCPTFDCSGHLTMMKSVLISGETTGFSLTCSEFCNFYASFRVRRTEG